MDQKPTHHQKSIRKKALFFTVIFHLIIFFTPMPTRTIKLQTDAQNFSIPVEMVITKPLKKKKKIIQKKGNSVASKVPQKPTRLPGDRDQPIVSQSVQPVYPKMALNYNFQGLIKVKLTISYKGKVVNYKIIKSTGHDILDQTFVRTVMNFYRFKPKRKMGLNKQGTVLVEYEFKL